MTTIPIRIHECDGLACIDEVHGSVFCICAQRRRNDIARDRQRSDQFRRDIDRKRLHAAGVAAVARELGVSR